MTKLQKWLLAHIAKDVVLQGRHRDTIVEFYQMLANVAREEFTEDNKPTFDAFLRECHEEALK